MTIKGAAVAVGRALVALVVGDEAVFIGAVVALVGSGLLTLTALAGTQIQGWTLLVLVGAAVTVTVVRAARRVRPAQRSTL